MAVIRRLSVVRACPMPTATGPKSKQRKERRGLHYMMSTDFMHFLTPSLICSHIFCIFFTPPALPLSLRTSYMKAPEGSNRMGGGGDRYDIANFAEIFAFFFLCNSECALICGRNRTEKLQNKGRRKRRGRLVGTWNWPNYPAISSIIS